MRTQEIHSAVGNSREPGSELGAVNVPATDEAAAVSQASDGLGKAAGGKTAKARGKTPKFDPTPKSARVTNVYDGDTVTLETGDHVRVLNVNCPEKRPLEPLAHEARQATEDLVLNKKVKLHYYGDKNREHYGRLLARVETSEGDLSEYLIRRGLGHVYVAGEGDVDMKPLLAAQAKAKRERLGIWALAAFQGDLYCTSFHANGRGKDAANPNVEYFRLANITDKVLNLEGYTVSNEAGQVFTLPKCELTPGMTVVISSGEAGDAGARGSLFLGSKDPIWNNEGDTLTVKDPKGKVVIEREYAGKVVDLDALPDPISQGRVRRLGADVDVYFQGPKAIKVRSFTVDDGDTIFFDQPKPGTFKVVINDIERDVIIADQKQTPEGKLAVRFMGVDTPETHVETTDDEGNKIAVGQGKPGELALKALAKLLKKASSVEVVPNEERPFDVYDRMLGVVWATVKTGSRNEKINVNEWLLYHGHGEMYAYYGPEFNLRQFRDQRVAARHAVENKLGIYSDGPQRCEERPSDFRRRVRRRPQTDLYVADWATKQVHSIAEIDEIEPYNRIFIQPNMLKRACADLRLRKP